MCNTYIVACVVAVCSYVGFSRLYSKPIADFILCYITMPSYLCCFIKEEELPACRPRPLKGHHKAGWEAGGQKLYKIVMFLLVLLRHQQKKYFHGLKKECKFTWWQWLSHIALIFLFYSSSVCLCWWAPPTFCRDEWKGEREKGIERHLLAPIVSRWLPPHYCQDSQTKPCTTCIVFMSLHEVWKAEMAEKASLLQSYLCS